jgi:hypothetical protein
MWVHIIGVSCTRNSFHVGTRHKNGIRYITKANEVKIKKAKDEGREGDPWYSSKF